MKCWPLTHFGLNPQSLFTAWLGKDNTGGFWPHNQNGRVRSQLDFHVEVDIWSSGRQVQSLCRSVMLPWKMILAEVGSLASENPNPAGYIWALWTYCEPANWRNLVSARLYLHIRPFYVALASFLAVGLDCHWIPRPYMDLWVWYSGNA